MVRAQNADRVQDTLLKFDSMKRTLSNFEHWEVVELILVFFFSDQFETLYVDGA